MQLPKERVERDEEDLVRLYLTDIGQYPLLTKDDEVRLAQAIEAGNEARTELEAGGKDVTPARKRELRRTSRDGETAERTFVQSNLRLVVSIAKKYQASGLPLLIVGLVAVIVLPMCMQWGLPPWRPWGLDEVMPIEVRTALSQRFSGGWHDIYPPLHYVWLSLVHAPSFLLERAGWLAADDAAVTAARHLSGRLLTVMLAGATIVLVYLCACEARAPRAAPWAAACTISLPFVYYAKTANLEVLQQGRVRLVHHRHQQVLQRIVVSGVRIPAPLVRLILDARPVDLHQRDAGLHETPGKQHALGEAAAAIAIADRFGLEFQVESTACGGAREQVAGPLCVQRVMLRCAGPIE